LEYVSINYKVHAYVLHASVINDAMAHGLLHVPIPVGYINDFAIIQYPDDTLIIMPADIVQMQHFRSLIEKFAISTGLKVNF
jgi:hypothetical protein